LPDGTGPGDVFGPVNFVIGFRAAATSAFAFANVKRAVLAWRAAPAAGIAVSETAAIVAAAPASGSSLRPRPNLDSYMRPPRCANDASSPE
jgi:hypothetical protein